MSCNPVASALVRVIIVLFDQSRSSCQLSMRGTVALQLTVETITAQESPTRCPLFSISCALLHMDNNTFRVLGRWLPESSSGWNWWDWQHYFIHAVAKYILVRAFHTRDWLGGRILSSPYSVSDTFDRRLCSRTSEERIPWVWNCHSVHSIYFRLGLWHATLDYPFTFSLSKFASHNIDSSTFY